MAIAGLAKLMLRAEEAVLSHLHVVNSTAMQSRQKNWRSLSLEVHCHSEREVVLVLDDSVKFSGQLDKCRDLDSPGEREMRFRFT